MADLTSTIENLQRFTQGKKYNTIYADPPWQFQNRTGKVAPEHKRLTRYETMTISEIKKLPIEDFLKKQGRFKHLFKKENEYLIEEFQKEVDRRWDALVYRCGR